mgnify:CR=1 FL=1
MFYIPEGNDVPVFDVTEHGNFTPVIVVQIMFGAAYDNVRLNSDLAQFGNRLLGRLGLYLSGSSNKG